jgi:co-chaperonin GroES (HSP10)
MAMASIDNLAPTRALIDLSTPDKGDFGIDDYELSFIFDDILLIEYVDETEQGDVMKGSIVVPSNALNKAWRKGRVILSGPDAKYAKEGDVVIFPNNMGVTISGVTITGKGTVKKGVFLNEERMFGICKLKDDNTKISS